MNSLTIPGWTPEGLISPIDMMNPTSAKRAPYLTDLVELVNRFGTSPQRLDILRGFLDFRSELHKVGLNDGFQWIDGSFTENIEMIENRPPKDIDVVTFFNLPANKTQNDVVSINPDLFVPQKAKWRKDIYKVDSYIQALQITNDRLVASTVYWYSLWSHRRDLSWKGFLQISLDPTFDQDAKDELELLIQSGGVQ